MRISHYTHSALTVFLGAFLLFVIQPIAGKQLLPYLGGSSSVWTTSLVFFTAALFAGYLYVYLITKMSIQRQRSIHLALIVISLTSIFFVQNAFDFSPRVVETHFPVLTVLASLLCSIGVPFFLLATTAPLVQYWYGSSEAKEPYTLYALSNTASFFALGYPFFIEPLLSLTHQRGVWATLFFLYILLVATLALRARDKKIRKSASARSAIFTREHCMWILLSALPAYLLVATTTSITKTVVPIPLLWVVPLALYLLTFIIAFSGRGKSPAVMLLFASSVIAAWLYTPGSYEELALQIISYCALLFFCSLACNVLLYRMRPRTPRLPFFYVLLSLGGALGTFAGSIGTALVFNEYWDFTLGLALAATFAALVLPVSFFPRILNARHIVFLRGAFIALVAFLFIRLVSPADTLPSIAERNFYGSTKVIFGSELNTLMHGTTIHGVQFSGASDALLPTSYFTPGSGVGRAILYEKEIRKGRDLRVGTIGLGVGTIASYCNPGDAFVFYEIDPRIERIARSHFSYLSRCDDVEVRIGDGRLTLLKEAEGGLPQHYDVLAVDAFSDDTIPMHLLTLEAFRVYLEHLRAPESILAMHISNRYLNLAPVVFRAAAELGMNAILVADSGEFFPGGSSSAWVLLSKETQVFREVAFANSNISPTDPVAEAWTDDYSSLLPVISIPNPWE